MVPGYFGENGIQIIDCIEFNRRFRCVDIACDLAFLAMDLDFAEYPHVAGMLIKANVDHSGDADMMVLMDFYKCYRALVRAKVEYLAFVSAVIVALFTSYSVSKLQASSSFNLFLAVSLIMAASSSSAIWAASIAGY